MGENPESTAGGPRATGPADDAAGAETPSQSAWTRGARWDRGDSPSLELVVDAAFDYRGDVTLILESGEELEGYVANRDSTAVRPFLTVFPKDGTAKRELLYQDIRAVTFSGRDTAHGKSWEAWVRKYRARKAADASNEASENSDGPRQRRSPAGREESSGQPGERSGLP